jgi:hypothetical protein
MSPRLMRLFAYISTFSLSLSLSHLHFLSMLKYQFHTNYVSDFNSVPVRNQRLPFYKKYFLTLFKEITEVRIEDFQSMKPKLLTVTNSVKLSYPHNRTWRSISVFLVRYEHHLHIKNKAM